MKVSIYNRTKTLPKQVTVTDVHLISVLPTWRSCAHYSSVATTLGPDSITEQHITALLLPHLALIPSQNYTLQLCCHSIRHWFHHRTTHYSSVATTSGPGPITGLHITALLPLHLALVESQNHTSQLCWHHIRPWFHNRTSHYRPVATTSGPGSITEPHISALLPPRQDLVPSQGHTLQLCCNRIRPSMVPSQNHTLQLCCHNIRSGFHHRTTLMAPQPNLCPF